VVGPGKETNKRKETNNKRERQKEMNLFKDKQARRRIEEIEKSLGIDFISRWYSPVADKPLTKKSFEFAINNINAQLEEIREHLGVKRVYHQEKITLEKKGKK
jgi:hypothetical protein